MLIFMSKVILLIGVIIAAVILSLTIQPTSTNAQYQPLDKNSILISNLTTVPSTVQVGDEFEINATIHNNSTESIVYRGDVCNGSPLDIDFDKKVQLESVVTCRAISFEDLAPTQNVTVSGPDNGIIAIALQEGMTAANVTFHYTIGEDLEQQKNVSQSFTFNITR